MKKLIAMLLAVVIALSLVSVLAVAEGEEQATIVIDGKKDELYTDQRSRNYSYWRYFSDNTNTTEPVDYERVKNHVWFTWDDDFIYMYFEAVSKYEDLYKAPEGAKTLSDLPSRDVQYFEQINFYMDTNPSAEYYAPHQQQDPNNPDDDYCNHFHCNANGAGEDGEGESKYYRIMARYTPSINHWNNYYRSDEGMFMTYDEFVAFRCDPASRGYDARYVDDPMGWYMKENGAAEVAGFIDYETNTYGFEMKYPRYPGEEYFQFNIVNDANAYEWEEFGPELAYTQSFAPAWWMNSDELLEIWFEDFEPDDLPPEVKAIVRMRGELPATLEELTMEHKDAVLKLNNEFYQLSEEHQAIALASDELSGIDEYLQAAVDRVSTLAYLANLGDVNKDSKIDAVDALVALRAAVGKVELDDDRIARADVTGDAAVNAKDALEMLQFAVGKREKFSAADLYEI